MIKTTDFAGPTWIVTRFHRLSPEENNGKNNIFVDVFDERDNRDRNPALRIFWDWEGRRPDENAPPVPLDKPDTPMELGHGNIPIGPKQRITVWIGGDGAGSERVTDLTTDLPDEGPGSTWGHFSYKIEFRKVGPLVIDPPIVVGPGPAAGLTLWQQRIERELAELQAWRQTLEGDGR